MGNINYEYIENYIDNLIEEENIFLEMRKFAELHHIPIVEKETAEFIKFLLLSLKPKRILELGTAIGYSTILLAMNSLEDSKVDSVELSEKMIFLAKENINKTEYKDKITIIHNDAADFLGNCEDEYDFIFIDAAKGQYEKYFDLAIEKLKSEGIIIFDNVLFKGMIASDDLVIRRKRTIVKRLRSFLPKIMSNAKYATSLIPLGDGVFVLRRKNV